MIMGLVKQLPIKMIIGSLMSQYISKNVKVIENKVTDKIENTIDLHYKVMYEEQLQKNEQQMKTEQQKINLLKFIATMQVLTFVCMIIRMTY